VAHYLSPSRLKKVIRRPGFWFILLVLAIITFLHYHEVLEYPPFLIPTMSSFGLDRHAFERILYMAPIVWAGFLFGWKGALVTSLVAFACLLPRALFFSLYPRDALFETGAVFIISNIIAISFVSLRKEREYRTLLEVTHQELQTSEERYRELFENALDAIWLHDLEGNIIAANGATEKLTGYSIAELIKMNVRAFLSDESLDLASQIRHKLLADEPVENPYEQHLIRRDKSEACVQLSTNLVYSDGQVVGFQNIARDITKQKRMEENLHFYLDQVTRAQEEERKRISHELHDETIQAMVVLSRQLDTLASGDKAMSEKSRLRLEEQREQVNNIMRGVRRLSQDLRPAALDRLGLLPALKWLAADVAEYSGIDTRVNVLGNERRLPEEIELVLFRITQEAMRNVWRHSQATETEITLWFDENKIGITVSDNGKGFNPPETMDSLARDGKLGLAGMQERARLVGGILKIQSEVGKGTSMTVELPA